MYSVEMWANLLLSMSEMFLVEETTAIEQGELWAEAISSCTNLIHPTDL